jgi:lipopolysaccharide assembly outer membrane protein LptD (OstA)
MYPLLKGEQRLYTERLSYNTRSKIATFNNNGTFTNGPTWVKSHSAIYDTNTDDIILSDRVFVQDPDFDIKTSKLKYNSKLRYVNFLAPAIVSQKDGTRLYSESGFYDIGKKIWGIYRESAIPKREGESYSQEKNGV